jgi:hypothetical protein
MLVRHAMECVMRTISKARLARPDRLAADVEIIDTGPGRVPGSTITSWPGPLVVDLAALFSRPVSGGRSEKSPASPLGPTIGGAASATAAPARQNAATVSLSDGTRITFATADRFAIVDAG